MFEVVLKSSVVLAYTHAFHASHKWSCGMHRGMWAEVFEYCAYFFWAYVTCMVGSLDAMPVFYVR